MIIDLASQDRDQSIETDVVIVGGGIAGLILATRLRDSRIRTVVLESGGWEQKSEIHPLNRVIQLGDCYSGATRGRFRCVGGTSTRWGGALIPFLEQDLLARSYLNLPSWPVGTETLHPYLGQVEKLFGVDAGSYEEDFVHRTRASLQVPTGDVDFKVRFAKWPAFKHRNVAALLRARIERDADLEIWINATATSFDLDESDGRIRSVTARHEGGKSVRVAAQQFAICAGAIELTRLLLLLNRQYNDRLFESASVLGCHFFDHISLRMGRIRAKHATRLNRLAAFRFVGKTMRSLRFELSPSAQRREGVGGAFGHISFKAQSPSGFDALRSLLRSRQESGRFQFGLILSVLRDVPYLAKASLWRTVHRQLYWPVPAEYELHVAAEQVPRQENRITLARETDILGMPLAAIRWRIVQEDYKVFTAFLRCFEGYWKRHQLDELGSIDWAWNPASTMNANISAVGDIFHPGGSTPMAISRSSGIVNRDLQTFAVPNLWVSSTSAFPTGGSANPTLTLMLLTMRLGDRLRQRVGR